MDDKFNIPQMISTPLEIVENIVGKEENAANQHFLLFPQFFPKAFTPGLLNLRDMR